MTDATLGDRELDVMATLWQHGLGTAEEVRSRLAVPLEHATVLTILRNLEAKGFVSSLEEGGAYRFAARITQQTTRRTALNELVERSVGGSPDSLKPPLTGGRKSRSAGWPGQALVRDAAA